MSTTAWGSQQEELLQQLKQIGFNQIHARQAIITNPSADIIGLIDWISRNPSPYTTPTPVSQPAKLPKEDDQLARVAKEEAETKKRVLSGLMEMGFSKAKVEQAMAKLPGASEERLLDWLSDPKNSDSKEVDDEPWVLLKQDKSKKLKKAPVMEVGTKVRVRSTVSDPTHGWGSVSAGEIGVVKRIEKSQDIWVDFPKQPEWHGVRDEMEIVIEEEPEPEEEEPGLVTSPKEEVMQIGDEVSSLKLTRTITVGSRVRVKKTISMPINGWGSVRAGDVGVVSKLDSAVYVDFPLQKGWKAELSELELADEDLSESKDKPKSPPSVLSSPKEKKLPPSPSLTRQESEDMLRAILEDDKKSGRILNIEQMNFLLLKKHKPSETYSCQVCYDDGLNIDKIFVLEECKHYLCVTCMATHIVTQMKSAKVSLIRCPEIDCGLTIAFAEVKRCIAEKDFTVFQQLLLEDSLKKDPSCRWCPRPGCGTAMMAMPNPKNPMMRCPKEDCKFAFCTECKEAWHSDATCEQYQQWKMENSEADQRYMAWAAKNTKPCPSCKAPIQKNAGCNHMKCINCRHEFCWLCMKSVLGSGGKYTPGHWALDPKSPCYEKMHT